MSSAFTPSNTSVSTFPTAMDNATATRLGYKSYSHGTTYNGGNAPTVTLTGGGGTLSSVTANFVPYQMSDGTWRMKFNLYGIVSSASRTFMTYAVNGVTFRSGITQPIASFISGANVPPRAYVDNGSSTIALDFNAATTNTQGHVSGDVALESKPTWAY